MILVLSDGGKELELKDKVAIITGAAGVIGKETVRLFTDEGAKVALVDISKERLNQLVQDINPRDDDYILIEADVSQEGDVERYVNETINAFGKIDILFNNAGIAGGVSPIKEMDAKNIKNVLNTNVLSVFYGLKHVIPVMERHRFGSIINSASDSGKSGVAGLGAYVAAKHAVVGLTKTAALECAGNGVRVNGICPTSINSRLMTSIEDSTSNPQKTRYEYTNEIPMGRYGESDEVAEVVMFLASNRSSFVTGSLYNVDGGRLAK